MSVIKLHNSLVGDPNDGDLKDAMDEEDDIIVSDFTLRSILPPQLKQISDRYKFVNVAFLTRVYIHHCCPVVIGI